MSLILIFLLESLPCGALRFSESSNYVEEQPSKWPGTCLSSGKQMEEDMLPCTHTALNMIPDGQIKDGNVCVIHYSKNTKRRDRLEKIFNESGLENVMWMTQFDKQDLSYDTCRCIFSKEYSSCQQPMNYGVANGWSQYALYYHMVQKNIPYVFVMEDDPYFSSKPIEQNFKEELEDVLSKAGNLQSWDMIHYGGCLGIHAQGTGLQPHPKNSFGRCSNGYAVSLDGAKKMLAVLRTSHPGPLIHANVDWMFNWIGQKSEPGCAPLQVYVLEPPLFDNGSQNEQTYLDAQTDEAVQGQYMPIPKVFKKIDFSKMNDYHDNVRRVQNEDSEGDFIKESQ